MTHPDGDTLLNFALQTLDEPDSSSVRAHMSACEERKDLHRRLLSELTRLQSIEFHIDVPAPPGLPRRSRLSPAALQWAALPAAGFLLGDT